MAFTHPDQKVLYRAVVVAIFCLLSLNCGCVAPRRDTAPLITRLPTTSQVFSVQQAAHHEPSLVEAHQQRSVRTVAFASASFAVESLADLERLGRSHNPRLVALREQVSAAYAKAGYVGQLPDPTVGTNVFAHPIETAAGSQRANITIRQMIPWLSRLDAHSQKSLVEAMSLEQLQAAEQLRVVGDIRSLWYKLFVIGKQLDTNQANQRLLKTLIATANARVSTGKASQGDVLLGTLELSKLAEQKLSLDQQLSSTKASLNRLFGRDAGHAIQVPKQLTVELPNWSHGELRDLAWKNQPAILAAELKTQATRWGIEVARLERRPDFSVSASWYGMDDNRPPSTVVDVGRDAWSIGAQLSVPIWHSKYDEMEEEAESSHAAAHASVDAVKQQYDSLLRDLWARAKAANETAQLYRRTILVQARQTLNADIKSYANGTVEFDRVMRDFRNVLTLELGYYRAIGELATAVARIQQATGDDAGP